MVKRFISAIAAIGMLAAFTVFGADAAGVSAQSAILIEAGSGRVLYEKDPDRQMLIASTTKIMTALVALENCGIESVVKINSACEGVEGSSMYLKAGEEMALRELLYGLMLESGNDAAVAVAYHVSGSVEAFVELMNEKAAELGCVNTSFKNPNGLDADGHYSTARDLAIIMAEAMRNELFEQIVSTKTASFGTRSFKNHNKLLWSYDGMIGGKTGYTMSAGRTLVTCAQRDGMRLICVTLDDPDDWDDHVALYDEAFSRWKMVEVCAPGETVASVPVISGEEDAVDVAAPRGLRVLAPRDSEPQVSLELPEFVYAQVDGGSEAGRITVTVDGEEDSTQLVYAGTVKRDSSEKLTRWERLKRAISGIIS